MLFSEPIVLTIIVNIADLDRIHSDGNYSGLIAQAGEITPQGFSFIINPKIKWSDRSLPMVFFGCVMSKWALYF